MKAGDIVEHFLSRAPWVDRTKTVDRIIAGDADTEVDTCLVTWMPSFEAVPALVEIICKVKNPAHKQLAVVCIEKIVKVRGGEAATLLKNEKARLRRERSRLRKAVASTKRVTPPKPWIHTHGSPGWFAAAERAVKAINRLLTQHGD